MFLLVTSGRQQRQNACKCPQIAQEEETEGEKESDESHDEEVTVKGRSQKKEEKIPSNF